MWCVTLVAISAVLPYFLPSEARPAETPVMNRTPFIGPMNKSGDPWQLDDSRVNRNGSMHQQD